MPYKYINTDGEFIPGIPARDLTDEEYNAIPPQYCISPADRLYEHVDTLPGDDFPPPPDGPPVDPVPAADLDADPEKADTTEPSEPIKRRK